MKRRGSFVVGVDGSATSDAALAWAAEHVAPAGVVHVVFAGETGGLRALLRRGRGEPGGEPDDIDDLDDEQLTQWLHSLWAAQATDLGPRLHTYVVDDRPADALMKTADDVDADLIVVGAHGAGDSRLVLGGVTTRLLRESDVPVVVVNPNQSAEGPAAGMVVACVGYGLASDRAAEWAADYAVLHGLPLQLLHVVDRRPVFPNDSPSDTIAAYFGPELAREWAQSDLDALKRELNEQWPDLLITTKLHIGRQLRAIEDATEGAGLVVLGKRRSAIRGRVIGHRLHHLVVRLTAPVAVVPSCSSDE